MSQTELRFIWHDNAEAERRTRTIASSIAWDGIPYGLERVEVVIDGRVVARHLYGVPEEIDAERADVDQAPLPRCPCGKWSAYIGSYDQDGYTFRCSGCKRSVSKCRC